MSNQQSLLSGEVVKEISTFVIEFEVTAKDVDSQTTITDTMLISSKNISYNVEKVEIGIKNGLKDHPIFSLTGNTIELENFEPTGKVMKRVVIYSSVSERDTEHQGEYPKQQE